MSGSQARPPCPHCGTRLSQLPAANCADPVAHRPRGFAALARDNPERGRLIAVRGGESVPPHLRSFSRDRDLATAAGLKGGKTTKARYHPARGEEEP